MFLFRPDPPQAPPRLCVLICLIVCSVPWPCESSETCPAVTKYLRQYTGSAVGDFCKTHNSDVTGCALQCAARPLCKLVKLDFCPSNGGVCRCKYCDRLTSVNFTVQSNEFYLQNEEIAADAVEVSLSGGLVEGQPLLLKVKLFQEQVTLSFGTARGDSGFRTRFYFLSMSVHSYLLQEGEETLEDDNSPDFNFTHGQEISMLYIVTRNYYDLYIDQVFFHKIRAMVSLTEIISIDISSPNNTSKILSCRR